MSRNLSVLTGEYWSRQEARSVSQHENPQGCPQGCVTEPKCLNVSITLQGESQDYNIRLGALMNVMHNTHVRTNASALPAIM